MTGPWIAAFVALALLLFLLALLVLGTLRRIVPVLERAEARLAAAPTHLSGLQPGEDMPPFVAKRSDGASFTDTDLAGRATLLLFLGSSCKACDRFVNDLALGALPDLGAQLVVVVDDADEARSLASYDVIVLVQEQEALAHLFRSDRVPHAFLVGEDGRISASGWPNDWDGLKALVAEGEKGGGRRRNVTAEAVTALRNGSS